MAWTEFVVAFVGFFVTHTVPVRPRNRAWLVDHLGPQGFTFTYSLMSLAALVWIVGAAGRAPHVPLWSWAPWQNHVVLITMAAVCLLIAATVGRPNPFSFGGAGNADFDPDLPGLVRFTRHPLLLALALWAVSHLVANGDLAHVLLFGTFGAFALVGQRIIDRRKRRQMGAAWHMLSGQVRRTTLATGLRPARGTAFRIAIGLLLYVGLLWLHPWAIGVSPLP